MNRRIDKWIRWIDRIGGEVNDLVIHRHVFTEVRELVIARPEIDRPSYFYQHWVSGYYAVMAMGIRRQVKVDRQSISLARLLTEIRETPELLSREYFKRFYRRSAEGLPDSHPGVRMVLERADRDFDSLVYAGARHISATSVARELADLKATALAIEELADRRLAHSDSRPTRRPVGLKEVNRSVEMIRALYRRYLLLLKSTSESDIVENLDPRWLDIFKLAWKANEVP